MRIVMLLAGVIAGAASPGFAGDFPNRFPMQTCTYSDDGARSCAVQRNDNRYRAPRGCEYKPDGSMHCIQGLPTAERWRDAPRR
jgi:hypothetical protein